MPRQTQSHGGALDGVRTRRVSWNLYAAATSRGYRSAAALLRDCKAQGFQMSYVQFVRYWGYNPPGHIPLALINVLCLVLDCEPGDLFERH